MIVYSFFRNSFYNLCYLLATFSYASIYYGELVNFFANYFNVGNAALSYAEHGYVVNPAPYDSIQLSVVILLEYMKSVSNVRNYYLT